MNNRKIAKYSVMGGTLLTIIAAIMWYTSYNMSVLPTEFYILVIGIIVWIYGDYKFEIYK